MSDTLTYQQTGTAARSQRHALFAQTMGYVALTAGLFAVGAWAGHDLAGGVGIIAFIAAFTCLIGMQFAVRRSLPVTVGLLGAFGLLIGLAVAPTVAYYGSMDPRALWEAGGATALFIVGFGAAGYATRRDLAPVKAAVSDLVIGDVAAALREHGSATLDEHCCYFRRPDRFLIVTRVQEDAPVRSPPPDRIATP